MARELALERTQLVLGTPEEVFRFFANPYNLEAMTPPWLRFRILEAPAALEQGSHLHYRLHLFGVPIGWHTEIVDWRPPRTFTDVQLAGPYPLWEHTHRFTPRRDGVEIFDHVRYRLPGGPLAPALQRLLVGPWLAEIFDYRAARLTQLVGR